MCISHVRGVFEDRFLNYFCFGCSNILFETGPLSGRPYGGIMVLIKKSLHSITETIHCEERFAIIKIANYIFINVYLPCEEYMYPRMLF